jgi:hypothetical protein
MIAIKGKIAKGYQELLANPHLRQFVDSSLEIPKTFPEFFLLRKYGL